jgi:hypothetical protein
MGKVIILVLFLSALLRLESKLTVAACRDASVIRGIFRVCNVIFQVRNVIFRVRNGFPSSFVTNSHAETISLDSSLKETRNKTKMMTKIPLPICNLIHL